MSRAVPVIGFAIAGIFAFACNAITGVGDLSEGSADVDAGLVDAPVVPPPPPPDAEPTADADAEPIDTGPPPLCPGAGRSCVPAPPAGWDGPFLAYEGERGAAPACPTEMPEVSDENGGAPAGTIACSLCRCGPVQGTTCTASWQVFSDVGCVTSLRTESLGTSTCKVASTGGYLSGRMRAISGAPGSCNAFVSPAGKVKSAVTWPNVVRLCARPTPFAADGCAVGELCVFDGAAPFKTHTCIAKNDGAAECPAPWTQTIRTYADNGFADTRDCSTTGCSCGTPNDVTCTAQLRHYAAVETCSGTPTATFDEGDCVDTPAGSSQRLATGSLEPNPGSSCNPSGTPTATGSVAAATPEATVCCLP